MDSEYTTKTTDPKEREQLVHLRNLVVITRDVNDRAYAQGIQASHEVSRLKKIRDLLWELDFELTDLLVYKSVNPPKKTPYLP